MDKAPKVNSTVASLLVAALAATSIALAVEHWRSAQSGRKPALSVAAQPAMPPAASVTTPAFAAQPAIAPRTGGWSASAPGRVEPRGGEVRVGAQMPGKVAQVLVRMNDTVKAGDLLVRLVDDEVMAKLSGALAEASVRRRERDGELPLKIAVERRTAEDTLSFAERAVFRARMDLDRVQSAANKEAKDIDAARVAVNEANDKLEQERASMRRVMAQAGLPLPTRLEASLAVARAELAAIEASVERTRVRAPSDGTVLLVNTRAGETATPSPEDVLLLFGDLTQLRVRAEIEERDVGKVRAGQAVVVRSDAFPGQDFNGRIELMANALGTSRLATKGPRRPNDQDVLPVQVELDGRPPLIPGMRVDVFVKPDSTVGVPALDRNRRN